MDIEVDEDLLRTVASGGQMDYGLWPALSQGIITRLDKIAHNDFPIPNLPPPRQRINPPDQHPQPPLLSSSGPPDTASNPSPSQDADKENAQPTPTTTSPAAADGERDATTAAPLAPGSLPAQIEAMLAEINAVLATFPKYPPHTIQRLAELVIEPRRHYRQLASYLHAVDRVVHVTSGANVYPLPPAVPDVSAMTLLSNGTIANGSGSGSSAGSSSPQDPAAAVSWGNTVNSAASTIGTDEALGGALLTPIPWLTRRPSPGSASPASSGGGSSNNGPAEIRTESTETIDGPNGVGSIETVSVSVNGIPSMGAAMSHINTAAGPAGRGITQGELLRQEQEQGVVPVNQLARQTEEAQLHAAAIRAAGGAGAGGSDGGDADSPERQQQQQLSPDAAAAAAAAAATAEDETETPHARGPEEIGVDDLGPQSVTTSFVGGPGVEMQGIDVEAAVGRKAEPLASSSPDAEDSHTEDASSVTMEADNDDAASETSATSHAKRDANEELEEGLASKKIKEDEGDVATAGADAADVKKEEEEEEESKEEGAQAPKAEPEDEEMKMEEVKEEDEKKPVVVEQEKKTRPAPPAGIE